MTSEYSLRIGLEASNRISSNPALRIPPMAKIMKMIITGVIHGSVTKYICLNRLAPSIDAASYSVGSTPAMAARYTMLANPTSFHTLTLTRIDQKYSGMDRKFMGCSMRSSFARRMFTVPLSTDNNETTKPDTMTQDKK